MIEATYDGRSSWDFDSNRETSDDREDEYCDGTSWKEP